VTLGREMAFTAGTAGLQSTPRALNVDAGDVKDTGWVFPGTSEINGVNAPNINADDGTTASLTGADGQTVYSRNFNFASIPDTAQIVGIEVRVERQSSVGAKAIDQTVILAGTPSGVDNKAGGQWPDALTNTTYGASNDLWGSEALTPAIVKDPSFGVVLVVRRANIANPITATIDHIAIRVYYVERGGRAAWIWDGTSDIPINIINVQILEGDSDQSSARGYITLDADVNSAKSRLVRVGDQIRSAPSGGGSQIGLVASRDRPIFLPGQFEVDNNRSQYQIQIANFFGQDKYAAAYGVSGAGPAFALPAGLILFREFAVSALREVGAARGLKLPVTGLAKWKTAVQLVALASMLGVGLVPALPSLLPLALVWVAAVLTVWTGIEYLLQTRRGLASLP
jgi:hypothetical protein